jgi:hypothetical protein
MSIGLVLVLIGGPAYAETATRESLGSFTYINCSAQSRDAALVDCDELRINAALDRIEFADVVERLVNTRKDASLLILDSGYLPIVVPRDSYEKLDSWEFSGRTYRKKRRNIANVLTGGDAVDAITVTDRRGVSVLSFWYSRVGGVRAIAIAQNAADAAIVYYCATTECVFGGGQAD